MAPSDFHLLDGSVEEVRDFSKEVSLLLSGELAFLGDLKDIIVDVSECVLRHRKSVTLYIFYNTFFDQGHQNYSKG